MAIVLLISLGGEDLLNELIQLFGQAYAEKGDALIIDNYRLKTGMYIRIDENGNRKYHFYDNKTESSVEGYEWFRQRDYLSNLLDMNKPIDPKKKLHSNNYMSLFIKKDTLIGDQALTQEEIQQRLDEYYFLLANPEEKYKKKKNSLELYKSIDDLINQEKLSQCKEYIVNELPYIKKELIDKEDNGEKFSNYIKIFFDADIEDYALEVKRYLIPNLYNSNDYNKNIRSEIFGLTNNNMGLNAKKPYLEHKTMVNSLPYLVSNQEILLHKKFFDWLGTRKSGCLYIKNDSNFITDVENRIEDGKGSYHFLYLQQGKEPNIMGYDFIPLFESDNVLQIDNHLRVQVFKDKKWVDLEYKVITKRYLMEDYVDQILFNDLLQDSYKKEPKEISKKAGQVLKNILILSSEGLFNYFRLSSNNKSLVTIISKYGIPLILNQLEAGFGIKAAKGFNLYIAILSQKGGRQEMPGKLKDTIDRLRKMINDENVMDVINDDEYYFLTGQIISYLLDKSKAKADNKKHNMANQFLECKRNKRLQKEVYDIFLKYSHELYRSNGNGFDKALASLSMYQPETDRVNTEMLLAGYLAKSIFYKKI